MDSSDTDFYSSGMAACYPIKRRHKGSNPYGWDVSKDGYKLIENNKEQTTIKLINRLSDKGLSLSGIMAELNKRGIKTRHKQTWKSTKVIASVLIRSKENK